MDAEDLSAQVASGVNQECRRSTLHRIRSHRAMVGSATPVMRRCSQTAKRVSSGVPWAVRKGDERAAAQDDPLRHPAAHGLW
jgi:hypothetical protein